MLSTHLLSIGCKHGFKLTVFSVKNKELATMRLLVCAYFGASFACRLPSRREGCDGEAVWVFSVSDLRLLHQAVKLFLGHVLHLLSVGRCLEEEQFQREWWWLYMINHDTWDEDKLQQVLGVIAYPHLSCHKCDPFLHAKLSQYVTATILIIYKSFWSLSSKNATYLFFFLS